jgi:hypothetical protein
MRKSQFNSSLRDSPAWMDLEQIAQVAVTSEDPTHPIECVFRGESPGWRAGGKGEQTIRLIFDTPQRLTRVWLRFVETEIERTQEFLLRWWPEKDGPAREIVRQQFNFSPQGATTEAEDYHVDVDGVRILELTINPEIGRGTAIATLAEWRTA